MSSNTKIVFEKYTHKKLCEMLQDIFKLTIRGKVISSEYPIELKKLFKKIPITKKGIKKFFNIIKRELSDQYILNTKNNWKRFFIYMRCYYRNQYKKTKQTDSCKISRFFFKKIKDIENECYQNCDDGSINGNEQYCPDIRLNKTIICKTCGKKRHMYICHIDKSTTKCSKCGECILFYYEHCCYP